jgi:hypothetical protein
MVGHRLARTARRVSRHTTMPGLGLGRPRTEATPILFSPSTGAACAGRPGRSMKIIRVPSDGKGKPCHVAAPLTTWRTSGALELLPRLPEDAGVEPSGGCPDSAPRNSPRRDTFCALSRLARRGGGSCPRRIPVSSDNPSLVGRRSFVPGLACALTHARSASPPHASTPRGADALVITLGLADRLRPGFGASRRLWRRCLLGRRMPHASRSKLGRCATGARCGPCRSASHPLPR